MRRILRTLAAAIGLAAYLWLSILLVEDRKDEEPLPAECSVPGATWADCRDAIHKAEAQA